MAAGQLHPAAGVISPGTAPSRTRRRSSLDPPRTGGRRTGRPGAASTPDPRPRPPDPSAERSRRRSPDRLRVRRVRQRHRGGKHGVTPVGQTAQLENSGRVEGIETPPLQNRQPVSARGSCRRWGNQWLSDSSMTGPVRSGRRLAGRIPLVPSHSRLQSGDVRRGDRGLTRCRAGTQGLVTLPFGVRLDPGLPGCGTPPGIVVGCFRSRFTAPP